MKRTFLALALLVTFWAPARAAELVLPRDTRVQVFFSPRGGCTEACVAAINAARSEVKVMAYSFTSAPIAGALKAAHDRGVQVLVILDKSQLTERYSGLGYIARAGIPVWVDSAHAIFHDKVIIVDQHVLLQGSFTKSAEFDNAENMLVIENRELAEFYLANWEIHRSHSAKMN